MSLRYYMDQHVPAQIADGLRRRGIDVLTAYEDDRSTGDDEDLLARATALRRILFSQDTDFLVISGEWQRTGHEFAGIVYAHQLNVTIGRAVRDLELLARVMDSKDMRNRIEYLGSLGFQGGDTAGSNRRLIHETGLSRFSVAESASADVNPLKSG